MSIHSHHRGFTLIELLAAVLLGTMMMLCAMGVLRSLGRTARSAVPAEDGRGTIRLLRWDLINARRFQIEPDGIVLWGFNSLDGENLTPTHRPARVKYHVESFAGMSSLMRTEEPMGLAIGAATSQLICSGVRQISLVGLPGQQDAEAFERNPGLPLPRRVEVSLSFEDGRQTQEVLVLR